MRSGTILVIAALAVSVMTAACSASAAAPPASAAPSAAASPASAAPSASAASAGTGSTVMPTTVGSLGTVLVAASTGMTVYTFAKDVKDSGQSNCTGACLTTWPALTVADGATPIAGAGASGKLGTITRADDGTHQVTYNGLPLYFYSGDHAPGDGNGVYTSWAAVTP